jgi:hypothetical protein
MKIVKIAAILFLGYATIVFAFESLIGYLQPSGGATLVITTFDAQGAAHDRVVSRLESDGALYVAANHWPRAWYRRALEKPEVQVAQMGQKGPYRAIPVTGAEHERIDGQHRLPFVFRVLTGFPPRYFLRLEPTAVPATGLAARGTPAT